MKKKSNNYAFIDGQNLYLAIQELGWKLDYKKFRIYLREKYAVDKAYMFMGFINSKFFPKINSEFFIIQFQTKLLNG